jgi:hypothetical protein
MIVIQQNTTRKKPPTLEQAHQMLEQHERDLSGMQQANRRSKTMLIERRAEGDEVGAAQCQQDINNVASRIAQLTETLEFDRATIAAVKERERGAANAKAYDDIRKQSATFKDKVHALSDSLITTANALAAARQQLDTLEACMRSAGVEPDRDGKGRLDGTIQLASYLETAGELGVKRTLLNLHELRHDPRRSADLKFMASEYHQLVLRRVRDVLSPNEPEAA